MALLDSVLRDPALRPALDRLGVSERAPWVLVTPQFRTSRHAVLLVLGGEPARVAVVVKVPRLPDDTAGIDREASILLDLAARGSAALVPRVVARGSWDGRPALVETGLGGRPVTHRWAAAAPDRVLSEVGAMLTALPVVGRTAAEPGWYERLVAGPLARLEQTLGDPRTSALVARTLDLTAGLRSHDLPLVVEHGDVTHPNLLLDEVRGPGLVDWELAEPAGLPGHDLLLLLAFLAYARAGRHDRAGQARAVADAFFGPSPWAVGPAREHLVARGVDPSLLGPLLVTTWARYAAALVPRLERAGGGPARLREVFDRDRDVAVWQLLVEQQLRARRLADRRSLLAL